MEREIDENKNTYAYIQSGNIAHGIKKMAELLTILLN